MLCNVPPACHPSRRIQMRSRIATERDWVETPNRAAILQYVCTFFALVHSSFCCVLCRCNGETSKDQIRTSPALPVTLAATLLRIAKQLAKIQVYTVWGHLAPASMALQAKTCHTLTSETLHPSAPNQKHNVLATLALPPESTLALRLNTLITFCYVLSVSPVTFCRSVLVTS